MWPRVCFSLFFLPLILSEVVVVQKDQTIYDTSPKVYITGVGFDAPNENITIDISANGEEPLRKDIDFALSKSEDGLILELLDNLSSRRWVDLTQQRGYSIELILKSVRFKNTGERNVLSFPVVIANVFPTPTIRENHLALLPTASQLVLMGTGLSGTKTKFNLHFDPPLVKDIAYYIALGASYLYPDDIVLKLRPDYRWRDVDGYLKLVGIDTGGGFIKINGDNGVIVRDIQTTFNTQSDNVVTVSQTGPRQFLHPDSKILTITGTGFNPHGTTLQFGRGGFKEYVICAMTETLITVKLSVEPGSGPSFGDLMLVSVDVGAGPITFNAGRGVHVATIVQKPNIMPFSTVKIFRTQTSKLFIRGSGFPLANTPQFKFNPPLLEGRDYTIRAIDQNNFELTLQEGRAWAQYPTPLFLTEINILGSDSGWFQIMGEKVAEIVDDDVAVAKLEQMSHSISHVKGMMKEMKGWMKEELVSALKGESDTEGMMDEFLEELKRVIREEMEK